MASQRASLRRSLYHTQEPQITLEAQQCTVDEPRRTCAHHPLKENTMMIHIYDAIIVGVCFGWITWQWLDYRRSRKAQQILDRIRQNTQSKTYAKDDE